MKIKLASLYVENCGPLKDVLIKFTDEDDQPLSTVVLAGANGSGKTTVLELIYTLGIFLGNPTTNRYFNGYIEFDVEFDVDNRISGRLRWDYGAKLLGDDETREFFIKTIRNRHQSMKTCFPFFSKDNFLPEDNLNVDIIKPLVIYFPHNRELHSIKGDQINREEGDFQFAYRYSLNTEHRGSFESYLIWLDYAKPELCQRALDFLNQLDFQGKTFHIRREELSVYVKTQDGVEHSLDQLSSGEQSILIMLFDLRRRLLPGSIVLIDEIENSLHPEFQHRLANGLLKLQEMIPYQLIITTHQHNFVEIFGRENTRILTKF